MAAHGPLKNAKEIISNWLVYIIFQTFRLVFKPLGLKEHQLRPQDFGEANLDTLKNRGNAYLPEKPPPYHLDMQLNVCKVYFGKRFESMSVIIKFVKHFLNSTTYTQS